MSLIFSVLLAAVGLVAAGIAAITGFGIASAVGGLVGALGVYMAIAGRG